MTNTKKPPLRPVRYVPMHEVRTSDQLDRALAGTSHLPGFLIRSTGLVDTGISGHVDLAHEIRERLVQKRKTPHTSTPPALIRRDAPETGRLHYDAYQIGTMDVHTTTGKSKVFLANSGPLMQEVKSLEASNLHYMADDETLARMSVVPDRLLAGQVDPQLMSRIIHTALNDDTVVLPLHNARGMVWHRFDTLSDERESQVTLIYPPVHFGA
jgi:hypothetical protein